MFSRSQSTQNVDHSAFKVKLTSSISFPGNSYHNWMGNLMGLVKF